MFLFLFALLLCSPLSLAIHESDVGVIDWHRKLIGVPLAPPIVHHAAVNKTTESILLVPTESNVLAALNTTDGSIVWRYVFGASDGIASFYVDGDVVVLTGFISLEKRLDAPTITPTGVDVAFEPKTGAMFVVNTHLITRVGEVQWTWDAPDKTLPYSKLVYTAAALYAVGLSQNTGGLQSLHLAAVNPVTGAQLQTAWKHLPPSVSSFVVAGDTVIWVDHASESLGFVHLLPTLKGNIRTEKTLKWLAIVDVDLREKELFVGVLTNGEAKVLQVQEGGVIKAIHSFPTNDGPQALFAGGLDVAGEPFVARLWTTSSDMTAVDIYSPGKELAIDGTRFVITTSTGAVQFWDQDQLVWGREEGLTAIDHAVFVELPLPERVARVNVEGESFVSRLTRQIEDAKEVVVSAHNHTASLSRDAFGFKQVLVTATAYGSVFGLDTASGAVLWTRILGLGWAGHGVGGTVKPLKIFVVDGEADSKDVVLIAQRKATNNLVDTVLFRIDPLTGVSVSPAEENTDRPLEGTDVIPGPLTQAFMLPGSDVIILIDEFFQVHMIHCIGCTLAPTLYLPFMETFSDGPRVVGHGLKLDPDLSDKYVAFRTWGLSLPQGENIKEVVKPRVGPVASIGKVLGNRTTLYKYLNPRMFVILTQDATEPRCGIYVVDGAKGSVLYSAVVPGAGPECDGEREGETKGWRLVTVELYEGGLDEKTSDMSAFSLESIMLKPGAVLYLCHGITAITTTSTKFGITSKDIIVATQNNKIHSIPRRLLNPRRPKNRKPTAEEQQEEQLIPYDVMIPDDSRHTISHMYEVANTRNIITTPALLESTSLVFAYGLDLFLTRVAPSNTFDILNKNFNKAQLVLTVSGLALGIIITKPMVRRKRLRERWYQ
ncbi:DUF1620-domain-containing protein, partial [Mycena leptocephala]